MNSAEQFETQHRWQRCQRVAIALAVINFVLPLTAALLLTYQAWQLLGLAIAAIAYLPLWLTGMMCLPWMSRMTLGRMTELSNISFFCLLMPYPMNIYGFWCVNRMCARELRKLATESL